MRRERFIASFRKEDGKLPRVEEPGATYFVTVNLLRPAVVNLTHSGVGEIVREALLHYDGVRYDLFDYTIMPDHVHMILMPMRDGALTYALDTILYDRKHWAARQINRAVGRKGDLWQPNNHTHVIRNRADYEEKARYIFHNPCQAGLVGDPLKWPWWGRGKGIVT